MNLGIERRKIEDRILAHYDAVNFDAKNAAWVDSDMFEDFVFSFFDLRKYYENSDDVTVGLEALRVYMDGLRALQAAVQNRSLSIERRDSAGRLIYELNYQMDAVMVELDRNRQAQGTPPSGNGDGNGDGGIPIMS